MPLNPAFSAKTWKHGDIGASILLPPLRTRRALKRRLAFDPSTEAEESPPCRMWSSAHQHFESALDRRMLENRRNLREDIVLFQRWISL